MWCEFRHLDFRIGVFQRIAVDSKRFGIAFKKNVLANPHPSSPPSFFVPRSLLRVVPPFHVLFPHSSLSRVCPSLSSVRFRHRICLQNLLLLPGLLPSPSMHSLPSPSYSFFLTECAILHIAIIFFIIKFSKNFPCPKVTGYFFSCICSVPRRMYQGVQSHGLV